MPSSQTLAKDSAGHSASALLMAAPAQSMSAWGGFPRAVTYPVQPGTVEEMVDLVRSPQVDSLIARGMGRSYGDASICPEGATLLTGRCNGVISFDAGTGVLHCQAGMTIREIVERFLPLGWFPAFTPGTKHVTVGGAIACDVHGKNHRRDGSLSAFIEGFTLALPSGQRIWCSRGSESDLFWATVGGMGLTGVICDARIALRRVQTAYLVERRARTGSLDEMLATLHEHACRSTYSMAWLDLLSPDRRGERGVVFAGDHAGLEDLPAARRRAPLETGSQLQLDLPLSCLSFLMNRTTLRLFNQLVLAAGAAGSVPHLVDCESFFFKLDCLKGWNRIYGPRGFVQYQCVFPEESSGRAIRRLLKLIREHDQVVSLATLKLLGEQSGLISFPLKGYTIMLDFPFNARLLPFLDLLDQLVTAYGGRVNLSKDSRLGPEAFRAMYPLYPRWLAVKQKVDPGNKLSSALSRRLLMHQL